MFWFAARIFPHGDRVGNGLLRRWLLLRDSTQGTQQRNAVIRARSRVFVTVSCSSFEHVLTDQMISSIRIGADSEAEECSAIML